MIFDKVERSMNKIKQLELSKSEKAAKLSKLTHPSAEPKPQRAKQVKLHHLEFEASDLAEFRKNVIAEQNLFMQNLIQLTDRPYYKQLVD